MVYTQALIWTNAGLMLQISGISDQDTTIFLQENASQISAAKWPQFCVGLNVLTKLSQRTSKFGKG